MQCHYCTGLSFCVDDDVEGTLEEASERFVIAILWKLVRVDFDFPLIIYALHRIEQIDMNSGEIQLDCLLSPFGRPNLDYRSHALWSPDPPSTVEASTLIPR